MHEQYIEQAIKGVLDQVCDFNFELIIADDCSPDNTRLIVESIIKLHPKGLFINYTRHEYNMGMHRNTDFVIQLARGKYIAICEGDDYWTDNNKLHKQVKFLEENLNYGLVHTNFSVLHEATNKIFSIRKNIIKGSCFHELLLGNYSIGTLTVCYRKDIFADYEKLINPTDKGWKVGDLPMWLYFARKCKFHYIDEVTSIYRVLDESASHTLNIKKQLEFEKSILDVKIFFLNLYEPNQKRIISQIFSNYYYKLLLINIQSGGEFRDFVINLFNFYKMNSNLKLFFGTFKQIGKKIISIF